MTPLTAHFDGSVTKPRHASTGPARAAWCIDAPALSGVIELAEATTAPVAEFHGLLALLENLRSRLPAQRAFICGDHEAVINLAAGRWKTWKPHLVELTDQARAIIAGLESAGWEIDLVLISSAENRAHRLMHPPKPARRRKNGGLTTQQGAL